MKKQPEVLITSGGTISKIDDVRHVGNFSTGTTGALIAEEFLRKGWKVNYLYTRGSKRPFRREMKLNPSLDLEGELERLKMVYWRYQVHLNSLNEYQVEDFEEYYSKTREIVSSKSLDAVVLAAAVSDYSAVKQSGKISSDRDRLSIDLVRNPKIIAEIKAWDPQVYLVGFKLLSGVTDETLIETAYKAGLKANSDLTVANTLMAGNFSERKIYLVTPTREVTPVSANSLPEKLVEYLAKNIMSKNRSSLQK